MAEMTDKKSYLVMKFGGTSLADTTKMRNAAMRVAQEIKNGHKVVVVVSAMGASTNKLVQQAESVGLSFDAREYDVLVSTGEQVSVAMMTMVMHNEGIDARSWLGWQLPIVTDSRYSRASIHHIDTTLLRARLDEGMTAVCAGFQGIDQRQRITTLGRGGSDTTAVALAVALGACRCDIYTDVPGIFTCDPRLVPGARLIPRIDTEEMMELTALGAKVLHNRSVKMALRYRMPLRVLSALVPVDEDQQGTWVISANSHTNTLDQHDRSPSAKTSVATAPLPPHASHIEDKIMSSTSKNKSDSFMKTTAMMESAVVTGIAVTHRESLVTAVNVEDVPGMAALVFKGIASANVDVDMIVQASSSAHHTNLSFTVATQNVPQVIDILKQTRGLSMEDVRVDHNVVKVSVVGVGMQSSPGVAYKIFETLGQNAINIKAISTSEIKVSLLIDSNYAELAVRLLHTAFDLDDTTAK